MKKFSSVQISRNICQNKTSGTSHPLKIVLSIPLLSVGCCHFWSKILGPKNVEGVMKLMRFAQPRSKTKFSIPGCNFFYSETNL